MDDSKVGQIRQCLEYLFEKVLYIVDGQSSILILMTYRYLHALEQVTSAQILCAEIHRIRRFIH